MVAECEIAVTCADAAEAGRIGDGLVEEGWAVCATHWPVRSCYRWQGEVVHAQEELLVVASVTDHFAQVCSFIRARHSYEVPAITLHPLAATGPGYGPWLRSGVRAYPHPSP